MKMNAGFTCNKLVNLPGLYRFRSSKDAVGRAATRWSQLARIVCKCQGSHPALSGAPARNFAQPAKAEMIAAPGPRLLPVSDRRWATSTDGHAVTFLSPAASPPDSATGACANRLGVSLPKISESR
jgi:hypothetical protein